MPKEGGPASFIRATASGCLSGRRDSDGRRACPCGPLPTLSLTAPSSLEAGAHRIALYTATGGSVGWARVTVTPRQAVADGTGTSTDASPVVAAADPARATMAPSGDLAATRVASGALAMLSGAALLLAAVGVVLMRVRRRRA